MFEKFNKLAEVKERVRQNLLRKLHHSDVKKQNATPLTISLQSPVRAPNLQLLFAETIKSRFNCVSSFVKTSCTSCETMQGFSLLSQSSGHNCVNCERGAVKYLDDTASV